MIDVGLIVQDQRVIAVAPIVADALLAIDDECVDLHLAEPRGNGQPGLPAPHHENGRIAVVYAADVIRSSSQLGPWKSRE